MFSPSSLQLAQSVPPAERKQLGIFFTPSSIRSQLVDTLPFLPQDTVLEPAAGSGEFLRDLDSRQLQVTAVEIHDTFASALQANFPAVKVLYQDFLEVDFKAQRFNHIVGNPPYFAVKKHKELHRKQYPQLGGKFDISTLFLLKCLQLLEPGGTLRFVLPSSFLNSDSTQGARELIRSAYTIRAVLDFASLARDWTHTCQKTVGLVVENKVPLSNDVYTLCGYFHTPDTITRLAQLWSQRSGTLGERGFTVKTGEVVWNNVRADCTQHPTAPLLVRNSYLRDRQLVLPDVPMRLRHHDVYSIREPVILVNRGHGNNGHLRPEWVYLLPDEPRIAENHIYKILDNGKNELAELFESLRDPRTLEWVEGCCTTGCLTKRFLLHLPIFE